MSSDELSHNQETFIAALLTLPTITAAAKAAGVSDKTAHVWLKQPHVKEAYKAARKEAFELALNALMDVVEEAIGTLRDIMRNTEATEMSRVRAAQILLEKAIEVHKNEELEARIQDLEEAVKQGR